MHDMEAKQGEDSANSQRHSSELSSAALLLLLCVLEKDVSETRVKYDKVQDEHVASTHRDRHP